ncbi:DUF547 domain-containing protein [Halorubrum sp. SP3]|uniref:DUF547 domain-containing protein n=1 Tax=Halorubrum sp. SP3 TaxID=1537265 RepID=UPI0010F518C5|nr:DUF547 domain-containing protein [Halorubrum sp. SP3]TKX55507.1 DUF547 domain-containing protein [Halorubrum sp. SP3]
MVAPESTPAPDSDRSPPDDSDSASAAAPALVADSQRFLRAVRTPDDRGPALDTVRNRIADASPDELDALAPDERIAFWLNVYNAATGAALLADPDRFEELRRLFGEPIVTVAGTELSLDQIEHGILRGSQWKYGLGYVPNPFPSAFVRRHRVADPDARVHFALNCGAASCPAVAAYDATDVDDQLDRAAGSYLRSETVVEEGTARVPRLLLWYRGDFGGRSGIRALLREHDAIDPDAVSRIRYREYDWSLALDAFRTEEEGR